MEEHYYSDNNNEKRTIKSPGKQHKQNPIQESHSPNVKQMKMEKNFSNW